MKWTTLRLLGAVLAIAVVAAACGSDAATETNASNETSSTMSDDEMSEMEEDEHADHDDEHSGSDPSDSVGEHDHGHGDGLDVAAGDPTPSVAVVIGESDTAGIYDLTVELKNFTITPENVDGEPVANEGHMHLLVNGVKIERFYDLERTVQLEPGEHVVEVELNANNHVPWTIEGDRINATQLVEVPGQPAGADVVIDVSFNGGGVTVANDRVEVELGQTVKLLVSSDVVDEVHLHGYDLTVDVSPQQSGILEFTADTAGKFEVEFEQSGVFIVEVLVS